MRLREQFQHLVDTHYDPLWSYAHFLTGGAAEGEDLLHQAFLLSHDHMLSGRTFQVDAGKWLRGTLRNLARSWWRDRRRLPKQLVDHVVALPDNSDDATISSRLAGMKAALEHCLVELPPADQELISKRYEQHTTVVVLAEGLQCNVATLRVRLFRIRQGLKACVEDVILRGGEA